MFKGHTDIILTDIRTGKETVYSDDNLVTKGLEEYLKPLGNFCGDALSHYQRRVEYLNTYLGGVLLFDDNLPEQNTCIVTPSGIKMTANGCYGIGNSSQVTELGSYDANESGFIDDITFRHVWTWTASQGIGRIKCVCLTSAGHGFVGEGNTDSDTFIESIDNKNFNDWMYDTGVGSEYQRYFADDKNDGILLRMKDGVGYVTFPAEWTSSGIPIHRFICPVESLDLRVDRDTYMELDTFTCTVNNPSAWFTGHNYNAGSGRCYVHDDGEKITLAIPDGSYYLESATNIYGILFDDDWGVHFGAILDTSGGSGWGGTSGYLIKLRGGSSMGTKYNIMTGESETITQDCQVTSGVHCYTLANGNLIFGSRYIYNVASNRLSYINGAGGGNGRYWAYAENPLVSIRDSDSNNYRLFRGVRYNGYLATINNLQSPVVKDDLHTMKLVYTMRFSNEIYSS